MVTGYRTEVPRIRQGRMNDDHMLENAVVPIVFNRHGNPESTL